MAGKALVNIGDREWLVEVAAAPWELEQGLGGLAQIPAGTGTLFDLGFEQTINVTTVPMLFSLDIAFISEDLKVTEVYQNVAPGYLVTSEQPARYFIEVNAGELVDIEPGASVSIGYLVNEWAVPAESDLVSAVVH